MTLPLPIFLLFTMFFSVLLRHSSCRGGMSIWSIPAFGQYADRLNNGYPDRIKDTVRYNLVVLLLAKYIVLIFANDVFMKRKLLSSANSTYMHLYVNRQLTVYNFHGDGKLKCFGISLAHHKMCICLRL